MRHFNPDLAFCHQRGFRIASADHCRARAPARHETRALSSSRSALAAGFFPRTSLLPPHPAMASAAAARAACGNTNVLTPFAAWRPNVWWWSTQSSLRRHTSSLGRFKARLKSAFEIQSERVAELKNSGRERLLVGEAGKILTFFEKVQKLDFLLVLIWSRVSLLMHVCWS